VRQPPARRCASRWRSWPTGASSSRTWTADFTDNRGPACYKTTPRRCRSIRGPAQDGSTHPPASAQAVQLGKLWALTRPCGRPSGRRLLGATTPAARRDGSGGADAGKPADLRQMTPRPRASQALGSPCRAFTASREYANSPDDLVAGLVADLIGATGGCARRSSLLGPLLRGAEVALR